MVIFSVQSGSGISYERKFSVPSAWKPERATDWLGRAAWERRTLHSDEAHFPNSLKFCKNVGQKQVPQFSGVLSSHVARSSYSDKNSVFQLERADNSSL